MILIVGGDSIIGAALTRQLRAAGQDCVTTSRQGEGGYFLDLANPPVRLPFTPRAAVLCAAATSLAACHKHPAETRRVNVEGSFALAQQLAAQGCFVVGLSTNLVFDGSVPRQRAEAPRAPFNAYGQQKAELEQGLLALGELGSIVRLTKVLGQPMKLLEDWRQKLNSGMAIHPYNDMVMAPIGLDAVVKALATLITLRAPGIFQLSAAADISYAQTASRLCSVLKLAPSLVQPAASGLATPLHTSLDTSRAEQELRWETPLAEASLDVYCGSTVK
jgi:dTDP-4-dehydrorhamnose reductase